MPEDIHRIFAFPPGCPFKVLQPHMPGQGPAVLVWVEVQKKKKKKKNSKPFIPNATSHTGQVQQRAPLLHSPVFWGRWHSYVGRTSAWPCFPARASYAPGALSHMSEPHALTGEAQICNYFVPVERTEPSCTCSNSCLWERWKALPPSSGISGSCCHSSGCVSAWLQGRDGVGTS